MVYRGIHKSPTLVDANSYNQYRDAASIPLIGSEYILLLGKGLRECLEPMPYIP
jgi:hypothetical protein